MTPLTQESKEAIAGRKAEAKALRDSAMRRFEVSIVEDSLRKTRNRMILLAVVLVACNLAVIAEYGYESGAKPGPILAKSEMTKDQIAHLNLAKPEKRRDLR